MELKIKFLEWSAGLPVAMLNKEVAMEIGVHAKDRVSIKILSKNSKIREITTIIDTIDTLIKKDEIAISSEIKKRMNLKEGQKVEVSLALKSNSLIFIKKKLDKKSLSKEEIEEIIKDVVNNSLSEAEVAIFISAMYQNNMSMKEIVYLINAILKSGNKLSLNKKLIVDKHSIGGIAGNRTTPLVVSICAAAGLTVPKNSSRAITSAAGTADVLETIADVDFSIDELKNILEKTNACMVWGGSWGMVPADSKIIQIERLLKIDPEAQLLASIMSKKLSVESKYILIDIPYGKGAKVSYARGLKLKKKFVSLGRHFDVHLKCVLTKGNEPIGNGIGPALELIDVIKILDPNKEGPKDLETKGLFIAGEILEMTGKAKKTKGFDLAKKILSSGKAFEKFKQIIIAQNGSLEKLKQERFENSKGFIKRFISKKYLFKKDILFKYSGKIKEIDNKSVNSLARMAGCPADKYSGVYLYFHVNDKVKKGEKILTIYSESYSRLKQAIKFYNNNKIIKLY